MSGRGVELNAAPDLVVSASQPPRPHPLDFDWRFDGPTTERLAAMLRHAAPVLAAGVPSVARALQRDGLPVTLVDRQPWQGLRDHVACAVEEFDQPGAFAAAIVDPPWYPRPFRTWTLTAARAVGPGGAVFVSAWTDTARPGAAEELATLINEMSAWADVRREIDELTYLEPGFETSACGHRTGSALARSPLVGELIRIDVRARPKRAALVPLPELWTRFAANDYQLALRRRSGGGPPGLGKVPGADGFQWPFVSARAPGRELIDLWSSEGEVATVANADALHAVLRHAFHSRNASAFETALAAVPALAGWSIPRPPYRRFTEWQHRQ